MYYENTWLRFTHRNLYTGARIPGHNLCKACKQENETQLHLITCNVITQQYWNFFFDLTKQMDLPVPTHKPSFLATRRYDENEAANEEVIGIFTIALRCLYAEFVKCRTENKPLSLNNAINRAMRLIHSRLKAYTVWQSL